MGNLCGKPSSDNFDAPGRPLGTSAPPSDSNPRASLPAKIISPSKISGQGRPIGGGGNQSTNEDPRKAAAKAAEERAAKAGKVTGPLGSKLAGQKKQTMGATLNQAAAEERAHRDAQNPAQQWD
ncbi:MAG: hypothetical protein M1834_008193 [Cirrosporium novae-zelandiae]|nr:MAG: hypothetical protein M1834_008193 [Cirrosporium novae-zelandiae]